MHVFSSNAGCTTIVSCVATIQNNPIFNFGFAYATVGGYIQSWLFSFTGTAQGKRAVADAYGIVNTGNINPDHIIRAMRQQFTLVAESMFNNRRN